MITNNYHAAVTRLIQRELPGTVHVQLAIAGHQKELPDEMHHDDPAREAQSLWWRITLCSCQTTVGASPDSAKVFVCYCDYSFELLQRICGEKYLFCDAWGHFRFNKAFWQFKLCLGLISSLIQSLWHPDNKRKHNHLGRVSKRKRYKQWQKKTQKNFAEEGVAQLDEPESLNTVAVRGRGAAVCVKKR